VVFSVRLKDSRGYASVERQEFFVIWRTWHLTTNVNNYCYIIIICVRCWLWNALIIIILLNNNNGFKVRFSVERRHLAHDLGPLLWQIHCPVHLFTACEEVFKIWKQEFPLSHNILHILPTDNRFFSRMIIVFFTCDFDKMGHLRSILALVLSFRVWFNWF